MCAFILLFIPPVFSTLIWDNYKQAQKKETNILRYLISLLFVTSLNLTVVAFVFKINKDIIHMLNIYSDFSAKYAILCVFTAVIFPYLITYIMKNIRVSLVKTDVKLEIKWRLCEILYAIALFVLNFVRIFDNNFWGDESYSILLSKMSFSDMLYETSIDVHPPLYYIILQFFGNVIGEYGWVYHMVSLLPYVLTLVFALTILRKEFGRGPSILMVTFSSVLYYALHYNVEVRMYSWAAFFVMVAFYALYLIMKKDSCGAYFVFVITSLFAAYTHYYAILTVAFLYIALLIFALVRKYKLRKVLVVYMVTIIGYLPWLSVLLATFKSKSDSFWIERTPKFKECIQYFFYSPKLWYSDLMISVVIVILVCKIIVDMGIFSINKKEKIELLISAPRQKVSDENIWQLIGIMATLWTIVIGIVVSIYFRPLFIMRYLYPCAGMIWLLVSVCIGTGKSRKVITIVVLGLTLLVCLPEYFKNQETYVNLTNVNDETYDYIDSVIDDDTIIITNQSHLNWTVLDYYFPENMSILSIDLLTLEPDANKKYCILWSTHQLGEEYTLYYDERDMILCDTLFGGSLGDYQVYVYTLEPSKN